MKKIINALENLVGYKPTIEEAKGATIGLMCCWVMVIICFIAMYIFR